VGDEVPGDGEVVGGFLPQGIAEGGDKSEERLVVGCWLDLRSLHGGRDSPLGRLVFAGR
jgi:hypothetical protein